MGGIRGRAGTVAASAIALAGMTAAATVAGVIPIPIEYETDSRPYDVAIGKIDGGAAKDIAVAHRDGRTVGVLLGDGNGGFADAELFETLGLQAQGVAIAKVNGDPRPDLVVAGDGSAPGTDALLVLRGKANGFKPPQDYGLPTVGASDVAVADLDRDGHQDAVVGDTNASSVVVKYGKGNGAFGKSREYAFRFPPPDGAEPTEPNFVGIADLNRDGFKDVATAVGRLGAVGVLYTKTKRRNGKLKAKTGKFRKAAYEAAGAPFGLAMGDLNRDGKLDLAVPNDYNVGAESISVLYGKGKGKRAGFKSQEEIDIGDEAAGGIAIGRFDPGPRPDIAVSTNTSGVAYLYGEADGFAPHFDFGLAEFAIGMAAARLNGDSEDDLVVGQWNEGSVMVILAED
jgi:FG-GAP-like repeat